VANEIVEDINMYDRIIKTIGNIKHYQVMVLYILVELWEWLSRMKVLFYLNSRRYHSLNLKSLNDR
jgi:hypothetical protein